jgi:uncharacterized protein RhaS with RHS repeats
MFYNYQRDYDPAVGRYSQSDPIGLLGGISTFGYVSGDPLSSLDPEGMQQRAATQAARSFANVAPTNPADGFQIHEGRYATHYPGFSPWSRPSFVPGPGILTTVAMAGMMSLVASPDGWSGIIGQFSNGKDSCPISGTTPDRKTKGNTRIENKVGGFDVANGDFDALWPGNVPDKGGGVRVGTLEDGRAIIVRPTSTDGSPTIDSVRW